MAGTDTGIKFLKRLADRVGGSTSDDTEGKITQDTASQSPKGQAFGRIAEALVADKAKAKAKPKDAQGLKRGGSVKTSPQRATNYRGYGIAKKV